MGTILHVTSLFATGYAPKIYEASCNVAKPVAVCNNPLCRETCFVMVLSHTSLTAKTVLYLILLQAKMNSLWIVRRITHVWYLISNLPAIFPYCQQCIACCLNWSWGIQDFLNCAYIMRDSKHVAIISLPVCKVKKCVSGRLKCFSKFCPRSPQVARPYTDL